MKTKRQVLAIALFCLFFLSTLSAQKAPIKWNKIPSSDLKMTSYELDAEAEAVVLCDYGVLEFDLSSGETKYVMKRHKRIKILTEEGFDQADISIPFYSYNNSEKVTRIDAQVINPDGSKQSIKGKEVFTEERNRYWSLKKFTIPGIKVGSVIEYRYNIESEFVFSLPEWYYQEDIPVRYSELRLNIPEWYDYLVMNQGLKVTKTEETTSASSVIVPGIRSRTTQTSLLGGTLTKVQQRGYDRVDAQVVFRRYIMENAPALRQEAFVTSMKNHLSCMRFQLRGVHYPGSPYESVMGNWNQVYKELMESESFGAQFNRKGKYKKALSETESLLTEAKNDQEKVQLLYNYLSENFEWNGFYGIYARTSLNDCFEQKTGNSADLNLLLLALLKANDIEAYPMLISTRSNGYPIQLYPILEQFNHVMVYAQVEDAQYLLDVHDPAYPINFPRENALNGAAWLMTDQPQWIDLSSPVSKTTLLGNFELHSDGGITGKIQGKVEGYDAIDERQAFREHSDGKHWKSRLTSLYPDATVSKVETKGLKNPAKPLGLTIECEIPETGQVTSGFIYLPPLVIPALEENPLQKETRVYPVEMLHPLRKKYIFNYTIPEGYMLEALPEPAIVTLPNNGGKINYRVSDTGGKVQVLLDVQINQVVYLPAEYNNIRRFFNLLIEKQNEQIILKKQT